jgi:hypothetical protein
VCRLELVLSGVLVKQSCRGEAIIHVACKYRMRKEDCNIKMIAFASYIGHGTAQRSRQIDRISGTFFVNHWLWNG